MLLRRMLLRQTVERSLGCGFPAEQLCRDGSKVSRSARQRNRALACRTSCAALWRSPDGAADLGVGLVFSAATLRRHCFLALVNRLRCIPAGHDSVSHRSTGQHGSIQCGVYRRGDFGTSLDQPHNPYDLSEVGEKALVSAVLLVVTIPVFYGAEGMIRQHVAAPWLATRWDASIPLVPAAAWVYMSWYLAPWCVLAAPARQFRCVATSVALTFVFCMICYLAVPVFIERPIILGQTLSERALQFLYRHDPP